MDIFVEQMLVKLNSGKEQALRFIGIAVLGLLSGCALVFSLFILPKIFLPLGLIVTGLCCWLTYYYNGMFCNEFEYTLTNGDFDVDMILNRKKRKRILSFDCRNVEDFYEFDEKRLKGDREIIFAGNKNEGQLFCIEVKSKDGRRVTVVIEPNEKMFRGLMKCLPRQLIQYVQNRY